MLQGKIIALPRRGDGGIVQLDEIGWRVRAETVPAGLAIGDRVEFEIRTVEDGPFLRQQRAVGLRRA